MRLACGNHGMVENRQSSGRVRLVETRLGANTVLGPHAHGGPTFTLVTAGSFIEEWGRRAVECPAGTLLFRPAFTSHRTRCGIEGARIVVIELGCHDRPLVRLPHAKLRVESQDAIRVARRVSRRLEEPSGGVRNGSAPEVEPAALDLAALSFAEAGHMADPEHPSWLGHAYERLADWPRRVPSITDLAREVGVHEDHLIRSFRDAYGETPGLLARKRRARVAGQMARAGSDSLSAIAWAVGYADQSHMTRELARFLGSTPGALRRVGPHIAP